VIDRNDPQQLHGYAYANNAPITAEDASGMWPNWKAIGSGIVHAVTAPVVAAGKFVYDHAGAISTITGVAALACSVIPPLQAIAPVLGAVSAVTGAIDTAKSCAAGQGLDCAIGIASMIPGGRLLSSARGAYKASKAVRAADDLVDLAERADKGLNKVMCFPAGTDIATPGGHAEIEDLAPGDIVLAYDPMTSQPVARRVTQLFHGETLIWIDIDTADGKTIRATRFHPFWVEDLGRWVDAMEIEPGMKLRQLSGRLVTVEAVTAQLLAHPEPTFNFEVEDLHDYFAGDGAILVHNRVADDDIVLRLLGIEHANKSAYESAQAIQLAQAKLARDTTRGMGVRIDIPKGDPVRPGNYPHAHYSDWSVNIDGSAHDATKAKGIKEVPKNVLEALRKAGWGC
jgi:hypothetical protein